MKFASEKELARLKRAYPSGTTIRLVEMDDPQAPPVGTRGIVVGVDDMGSLLVNWETGSSLSVIYGVDRVSKQ